MARKPSDPRTSAHSKAAAKKGRKARTQVVEPDERYGPVTLTRYVKDDGRALILYTRDDRRRV